MAKPAYFQGLLNEHTEEWNGAMGWGSIRKNPVLAAGMVLSWHPEMGERSKRRICHGKISHAFSITKGRFMGKT